MRSQTLDRVRPRPRAVTGLLLCIALGGCGADTYKARLRETAAYFSYRQKLKEELGPRWSVSGVSIQPPRQFGLIAPPAPPAAPEEGEASSTEADAGEDPRQPHYLGIQLPGLLGAWEASVRAEVGGRDEERKAYLYVLGNHSRHLSGGDASDISQDPKTFLTDVENLLTGTIGVVLPKGETGTGVEKNQRYRELAPRVEPNSRFTPRKDFTAVTLTPRIDVGDWDLPFEMQLYEWGGQQIQVAILMVYPQSISPRERLQERLLLALETLEVNDTPPAAPSRTGAGGDSGRGGGRPAGF